MAKSKEELDREIAEYGKNELLNQALDRAVLRGALRLEAVKDALALFGDKCVVDADTMQITLNGLSLDAAVAKLCKDRPLWVPTGPNPETVAQQELEAACMTGDVTSHGKLWRSLGQTAYDAWCRDHAAKPGKSAVRPNNTDAGGEVDPKNPFVGLRGPDGRVDPTKREIVASLIKNDGIAVASKLAREAGVTLSGHPLRKAS